MTGMSASTAPEVKVRKRKKVTPAKLAKTLGMDVDMAKALLKMSKYVRSRGAFERLRLAGYKDVMLGSKLHITHNGTKYYFAVILGDGWHGYRANTIAISLDDNFAFAKGAVYRLEFATYDMMMEFIDAVLRN